MNEIYKERPNSAALGAYNSAHSSGAMSATSSGALTHNQFLDAQVKASRYAETYRTNKRARDAFTQGLTNKWVESLKTQARTSALPNAVLRDFSKRFGDSALLSTFRGQYEKGIQGFVPTAVRQASKYSAKK